MDKIINILGSGWKGYVGGIVLLLGSIGLGADYVGQLIGVDAIPGRDTSWPEVAFVFGNALAALGIRHKQDISQEAMTETQEDLIDEMADRPQKKGRS